MSVGTIARDEGGVVLRRLRHVDTVGAYVSIEVTSFM